MSIRATIWDMSTAARNNNTRHVMVEFADGESFHEKHRDSFGGFLNMLDRVAARVGATDRQDVHSTDTGNGVTFTVADRSFTMADLVKVGGGFVRVGA